MAVRRRPILTPSSSPSPNSSPSPKPKPTRRRSARGDGGWVRLLVLALVALWFASGGSAGWGATPEEEERAYAAAAKTFQDQIYDLADKSLGEFAAQFPQSARLPQVFLLQAQARLRLKQFDPALALLAEKLPAAAALADEYHFWMAETRLQKGELGPAADTFAQLLKEHPTSPRRLEAAYSEAFLRFRLGDTARAIAALSDPQGGFQTAARAAPDQVWTVRGWLLLAEAQLVNRQPKLAEQALAPIPPGALAPELAWQRSFLLARAQLADNRPAEALTQVTNLWGSVTNTVRPELLAEATATHGHILELLNQPEAAAGVYERNLLPGLPPEYRRRALQRIVFLNLQQQRATNALQRLEGFIAQQPGDETLDWARLTLGELRLKEYHRLRTAPNAADPAVSVLASNVLAQARLQFDTVVTNFPNSALLGRAWLNRGWCLWERGTNALADTLAAFKNATEKLPPSEDQAVARFKWADVQFLAGDYPQAATNYWQVVDAAATMGGLRTNLLEQALYQIVRASIAANDVQSASAALARILALQPEGFYSDRVELLVGQALTRQGRVDAAREVFADFTRRFTNSTLLPQVRLAIARTHEQERQWGAAIGEYQAWLGAYTNHPSIPQAAFDLARVSYLAGPTTNALPYLTDFVARFPQHPNAPLAQYLVAEYHFNQGDYANAELNFQSRLLFQNTNALTADLGYRARLMAGRAAVARQSYANARDYFNWLITNGPLSVAASPLPVSVVAEAYLFLGDTIISEAAGVATNALARYGEAIVSFSKIAEHFPTNEFAPLAWGRLGDCHLQLAARDPAEADKRYTSAAEAYRKVIASNAAAGVRSLAERRLGIVLETQAQSRPAAEQAALREQALKHYLRVLYRENLRPGEAPDAAEVREAGLAAATLAETQKQWDQAIRLYQRLITELPPLRGRFERRLEQAIQARAAAGGGG